MEPFRCIIDRQIRKAYNLHQFKVSDFELRKGQYFLSSAKSRDYTRWLVQAILEHKEAMFSYVQAYYRAFIRQKPIAEFPFFEVEG